MPSSMEADDRLASRRRREAVIAASVGNLRDLGGLHTATGRRVAHGKVYRSSNFSGLSESDVPLVEALRIRTVVDLRGQKERAAAPGLLKAEGLRDLHLPIEPRALAALRDLREAGTLDEQGMVEVMRNVYRRFVNEQTAVFGALIRLLQDEDAYPLVFHCTAGKDRTGFAAAMILLALGVPFEDVVEDFMLSNGRWQPAQLSGDWTVLGKVRAEYIEVALQEIERGHGSIDAYLATQLGLDAAARERLGNLLLED